MDSDLEKVVIRMINTSSKILEAELKNAKVQDIICNQAKAYRNKISSSTCCLHASD
jgi:hypothetical protein